MSVVVIGVNQRSVPIDVFEQLAIGDDHLVKVLDDLTSSNDIAEAVVLSTCNVVRKFQQHQIQLQEPLLLSRQLV